VTRDGAVAPVLSSTAPRPDHPEWDVVLWFNTLSFPGATDFNAFAAELERWFLANYSSYGAVRPEWAKSCAHTAAGHWTDLQQVKTFRAAYTGGPEQGRSGWDWAVRTLDRYDPHRVFTSPLLETLMGSDA
jgi:hypothetical protein